MGGIIIERNSNAHKVQNVVPLELISHSQSFSHTHTHRKSIKSPESEYNSELFISSQLEFRFYHKGD